LSYKVFSASSDQGGRQTCQCGEIVRAIKVRPVELIARLEELPFSRSKFNLDILAGIGVLFDSQLRSLWALELAPAM
jgi:hypothetical protein